MAMIENISEIYETIKCKYPTIKENTRVHMWPDENLIITKNIDNYKELNSQIHALSTWELDILVECDGKNTANDIIKKIKEKYKNIENIKEKVIYIFDKYNNTHLNLKEEKQKITSVFEITGNKEYIIPIYFMLEIDDKNLKAMSSNKIMYILKSMYNKGCRFIQLIGDDILSCKDINSILEYLLENYDLIAITTNNLKVNTNLMRLINNYQEKIVWNLYSDESVNNISNIRKELDKRRLIKKDHVIKEIDKDDLIYIEKIIDSKISNIGYEKLNCGAGWKQVYIKSDGSVKPCLSSGDRLIIGNVMENSIENIFYKQQSLISILKKMPKPSQELCGDCIHNRYCKFCICKAITTNLEKETYCNWVKYNKLENAIEEYKNIMY